MGIPTLLLGQQLDWREGDDRLSYDLFNTDEEISVLSSAFLSSESIPPKCSRDGQNVSPPINWSGVPANSASIALIVEDPDAPTPEPYVHWMLYNIDPTTHGLPGGYMGMGPAMGGRNSTADMGYVGMAPPQGDLPHHYHFQVFALNKVLNFSHGLERSALIRAMKSHVTAKGRLIGTFSK